MSSYNGRNVSFNDMYQMYLNGKYTVFGQLIEGLDVLEKIGDVEIEEIYYGRMAMHKPIEPVVMEKVFIEKRVVRQTMR